MLTVNSIVRAVNARFVGFPVEFFGSAQLIYLGAVPAASDTISPGKLLKDFQSVVPNSGSQKHQREVRHSTSREKARGRSSHSSTSLKRCRKCVAHLMKKMKPANLLWRTRGVG